MDWSTTFRIHPVNFLIYSMGTAMLIQILAGFAPLTFVIYAPLNFAVGTFVHANLNWTLRTVPLRDRKPGLPPLASRGDPQVRDKNFAPTFPVLDLMFGTFYMPKGRLPEGYGVEGVPTNFLNQMIYPLMPQKPETAEPAPETAGKP